MNPSKLEDQWANVKLYKLKVIFDGLAVSNKEYKNHTCLEYDSFITLFPEMKHYSKVEVFIFRLKKCDSMTCSIMKAKGSWTGRTSSP